MKHIKSYNELKIFGLPLFKQGRVANYKPEDSSTDPHSCISSFPPIDAFRTALLVVDVQPEYWSECPAVRKDFPDFPSNLSSLVDSCREHNMKRIIWVRAAYNYEDSPWLRQFNRLHQGNIPPIVEHSSKWEEFAKPLDDELVITKTSWSSTSGNTGLLDILKEDDIESVLVCGLITSVCVQHSAFGVFEAGYRTILVTDACADRGMERHKAALALYGDYMYELRFVHCLQADLEKQPALSTDLKRSLTSGTSPLDDSITSIDEAEYYEGIELEQ
jgi:nicotinamidase-related amidase